MMGLTRIQSRALEFIAGYIAEHNGVAPSFREISSALNLSLSGVGGLLRRMQDRGAIQIEPTRSRSIVVLSQPAGNSFTLPPRLKFRLDLYCSAAGEKPESVVIDAVKLMLDELGSDVVRKPCDVRLTRAGLAELAKHSPQNKTQG